MSFCTDDDLGYRRSRTVFEAGAGLKLDESYRLAHLPLVAPGHPAVIATRAGSHYTMGRHPRVVSLVLPIPAEALERSPAYRELDAELRAAPFAAKIAWDLLPRRRARLHAMICGAPAEEIGGAVLAGIAPFEVELRGLFSGNVNVGRLYLKLYPENVVGKLQRALGRRETDLHVVGLWNLIDDLDAREAAALSALIDKWWDRDLLRFRADTLWLLGARDDLVLESDIAEVISLI